MRRPYRILGLSLILAGIIFAPVSYFVINSAPLAAAGVSTLVLGFTCFALAGTRPNISPEAAEALLEAGAENIAALLEELFLHNKAIYLPSAMTDNRPRAIIPFTDKPVRRVGHPVSGRLVVRFGAEPDELAIAVSTPGGANLKMVQEMLGPTRAQLESAMSRVLVGVLDMATSVGVAMEDHRLRVEIAGARLHSENVWYRGSLGSPLASVVAAISAEGLGKPVRIRSETFQKRRTVVDIEVLE